MIAPELASLPEEALPVRAAGRGTRSAWPVAASALLLGAALLAPSDAGAQAQEAAEAGYVTGQVLDDRTGNPIPGVHIRSIRTGESLFTDPQGRFRFAQGEHLAEGLALEALGYHAGWMSPEYIEAFDYMEVGLTPNPFALEGIEVMHDRFERRRRGVPVSTQVLDVDDLWGAGTVLETVVSRAPGLMAGCGEWRGVDPCMIRRGRAILPEIVIDEMPAPGGAHRLEMMDPAEVHMVEIYDRGAQIRVYTRWFMEHVLERNPSRIALHPIITLMPSNRSPNRTLGW